MATGLDPEFAASVQALIEESGGKVWIKSGFRSVEEQAALWDVALKKYGSEQAARKWVAPPGNSNHNHGLAVDLGGDLALAAQLAAKHGLTRPMSWEPWHFEPVGARDGTYKKQNLNKPEARTLPPDGMIAGKTVAQTSNPGEVLRTMLGIQTPAAGWAAPALEEQLPGITDPDRIAKFLQVLRAKESSGNYREVGPNTKWGRATGAYQYLDSTWGGYKGFARAKDAPRSVQDEKARLDVERMLNEYGNYGDVASAWFSGPNGNWGSTEVRDYRTDVLNRMGIPGEF